jgi:hypothetical protein
MPDTYPPTPVKLQTAGGSTEPPQDPRYYPPTPSNVTPPPPTPTGGGPGSSGGGFNRKAFIKAYANMVARTWVDEQYLELLLASPVEVLERAGIHTIPGAVLRIIQHKITGSGKIEDQVDAWITGNRTGLYDLYLPMKPDDVEIPTTGGAMSVETGDYCCCCCPCCCCT